MNLLLRCLLVALVATVIAGCRRPRVVLACPTRGCKIRKQRPSLNFTPRNGPRHPTCQRQSHFRRREHVGRDRLRSLWRAACHHY